jgi:predicted nucleic acid-binding protein
MPAVVDASAFVGLLIRRPGTEPVAAALAVGDCMAPGLLDAEVLNALAGLERSGKLSPGSAEIAVRELVGAPIRRFDHPALTKAAWTLRRRISPYDAMYAALAVAMKCPLVTADARLARAMAGEIAVTVVPA